MRLIKLFLISFITFLSINLQAQTYITATGGTVTSDGNYKVHTFISGGTFTVTQVGLGTVEILVVAGGGSGGVYQGGGGGGGGIVYNAAYSVSAIGYPVTIGASGASVSVSAVGNIGGNSVFNDQTAYGGGFGGGNNNNGGNGGSGGGASKGGIGGTGSQGKAGGNGGISLGGAGGGGNSSVGANGIATDNGGNGGAGTAYNISGTSISYAGGGGGAGDGTSSGSGGAGGGGAGGLHPSSNGINGGANTGGGGGGAWYTATSGAGGSGVVIIRYQFQGTTPGQWTASANNTYYDAGSVGIGTGSAHMNDVNYKLFVAKGIRTEKLKVDVPYSSWPDYVFHEGYKVPSLEETETYIKLNQHLPGVPSAAEMEKNGIDLGKNQALLLRKIEELTLLMIKQNKRNEMQLNRISRLEKTVKEIKLKKVKVN